ncbi:MAG: hypothetical protein ACTSYI_00685 [Promethearchaeota archaeon]
MHGFLHIMLVGANSGTVISSFDNLSLDNPYFDLNFLEILTDQGIILTDHEWLENTEIKIQLENVKFPLVYHFAHNDALILVVVATKYAPEITSMLEGLLEDLKLDYISKYAIPSILPDPPISSISPISLNEKSLEPNPRLKENFPDTSANGTSGVSFEAKISDNGDEGGIQDSITSTELSQNSPPSTELKKDLSEIPTPTDLELSGGSSKTSPLEQAEIDSPKNGFGQKYDFLCTLAKSISEYLLPNFLIPEKRIEISESSVETHSGTLSFIRNWAKEKFELDFDKQIWQKVDGTWTIQEFADIHAIEIKHLREILFFLWKSEIIILRLPFQKWDIFRATIKAPLFLDEGSAENLMLIGKYNSSKIIQLLAFIGEGSSYLNLTSNFDMTKTKLSHYLSELLQRQIILRKEYKPVMVHIPEDLIPLLSMQGFTKSDFAILNQLARLLDGSRSLQSTALDLKIDPNHLKILLDKYEIAVKIIT